MTLLFLQCQRVGLLFAMTESELEKKTLELILIKIDPE